MSLTERFMNYALKAQRIEFCHKKLIKLIETSFDISNLEEFLKIFIDVLRALCFTDYADKNQNIARGLNFLAKLAIKITFKCVQPLEVTNPNGTISEVYDITVDPFFNSLLKSSLKYSLIEKGEVRFNTCYFIMVLLQNISNNVEMDNSVCKSILDALLPLLHDPKTNIRLQAIKAVVRLQEPGNPECEVMKSFLLLSTDTSSEVRKAIVSLVALQPQNCSKIRERLNDIDIGVRHAAYMKFSDVNPKFFLKIIDRNFILTCGFADKNNKIHNILIDKLLPKWLNYFGGNYLNLIKGLKLDADESDFKNFKDLCTKVLDVFLSNNPLTDILKYLPVNEENKLIPVKELCLENILYWSSVISFLRKQEHCEEYLNGILPELTTFSNYIERVIKEKSASPMDEWEKLEYQNIIFQLFEIASDFDMSDEVGRRTFYSLIIQILSTYKFQQRVIEKIICVALKLNSNFDTFTIDLCQVISEIREPLTDHVPSQEKLTAKNFEMSKLKVKMYQLEIAEEEAIKKKDFQHAGIVHNEYLECQRELEKMKCVDKVRVVRDDSETLCRCLDILIGLMKLNIQKVTPALLTCRNEFLIPLLSNTYSEVHWRFILSLAFFCLMDRDFAFQHANFICLPIATYKTVPNYDRMTIKISVSCISDLIRKFGIKVIGINKDSDYSSEQSQGNTRRKLYCEDMSELSVVDKDDISIEFIIDIILDMLDDEEEDIRDTAVSSISKLMVSSVPVGPELMQRLILKWYNPLTEKKDTKLQQKIGCIIQYFSENVSGARKVINKAVIPIISSIANAPRTSPLIEIDIENVLRFLAVLTAKKIEETENYHNSLAVSVIEKILNKPNDICTPPLTKLLTYLDVTFEDAESIRQMISWSELLLEDLIDRGPKRNIVKFLSKVKTNLDLSKEVTIPNATNCSDPTKTSSNLESNGLIPENSKDNSSEFSQEINTRQDVSTTHNPVINKRKLYTDNCKEHLSDDMSSDNDDNPKGISRSSKRARDISSKSLRRSRSSSEETILKTFLQGGEEFQDLEHISIQDVTSESNTTIDSKKENLSISSVTSISSTRSRTRKRLKVRSPNHKSTSPRKKKSKRSRK